MKEAVAAAAEHIEQAEALLAPYLLLLHDRDRRRLPKARAGFFRAGRQLARALAGFPGLAAAADVDPGALVEHLDNVDTITPLAQRLAVLSQRLSDSRLSWLAEAWTAALRVHRVAKVLARNDATVRAVAKPLAEVFPTRRTRRAKKAAA
ncbi:MAG: hypothetical protein ACOX6T_03635 [Myxococcales bacterium]